MFQPRVLLLLVVSFGLLLTPSVPSWASPILDPVGDTFNSGTIDIIGTELLLGFPDSRITIQFAAPIAPPSAGAPNSVVGFIDLDTAPGPGGTFPWFGPVTGGNNWINFFVLPNPGTPSIPGPFVALGDEFFVDVGSELFHPGLVDFVETVSGSTVGTAPASFIGNLLTIDFPSSFIGNPSSVQYGALLGDFFSPTDRAPNGDVGLNSQTLEVIPEPSSVAVWLSIGLVAFGMHWRRRRSRQ